MITAEAIEETFLHCLFRDEEMDGEGPKGGMKPVVAEGVTMKVGFHPGRLAEKGPEITAFIGCLEPKFRDGMSFLQLPFDAAGNQWGEHRNAEQLMLLAIASGRMELCAPRAMWPMLPGGVPFLKTKKSNHA